MSQPAIVPNFSPKPYFNRSHLHRQQHQPHQPHTVQHRSVYMKRNPSSPSTISPVNSATTTSTTSTSTTARESHPYSTPQTPIVGSLVDLGDAMGREMSGRNGRGRSGGGTDRIAWSGKEESRSNSDSGHPEMKRQFPNQHAQIIWQNAPLSSLSPPRVCGTSSATPATHPVLSPHRSTYPSVLRPAPTSLMPSTAPQSSLDMSSTVMAREVQNCEPFHYDHPSSESAQKYTRIPALGVSLDIKEVPQTDSVPLPRSGTMISNRMRKIILSPTKSAPALLSSQQSPRDPDQRIPSARLGREPRSASLDRRQPPGPRYAYNASSTEEEAHRAKLVRACEGLSSLCSQWHGSDYNRMKWGAKGSPRAYCPLTIVAPKHVAEIMNAQAAYESQLFASSDDELMGSASGSDEGSGTSGDQFSRATTISDTEEVKTPGRMEGWCESPVEDEVVVVDAAECAPSRVLDLHIERPKGLKEEEGFQGTSTQPEDRPYVSSPTPSLTADSPMLVDSPAPTRSNSLDVANNLREAMESALSAEQTRTKKVDECVDAGVIVGTRTAMCENGAPMKETKTSDTHPINISLFLPDDLLPAISTLIDIPEHALDSTATQQRLLLTSSSDIFNIILSHMAAQPAPVANDQAQNGRAAAAAAAQSRTMSIDALPLRGRGGLIGNLLLSSCPGKKVRLDGPVRGRGAICRDLTADLERVKGMGVGCIVCCLDDNELMFLGAPWDQYKKSACKVGLDIVRIPMPEGLTPASLVVFDDHIEKVVRKYTLKGVSVLAHCRGGIGRAGLTACAWAVKLGIVGSSPDLEDHLRDFAIDGGDCDLTHTERENARVMSTVERVICLIRRRRSVKAIETFEQVNFLATYIAWLRRQSDRAGLAERNLAA